MEQWFSQNKYHKCWESEEFKTHKAGQKRARPAAKNLGRPPAKTQPTAKAQAKATAKAGVIKQTKKEPKGQLSLKKLQASGAARLRPASRPATSSIVEFTKEALAR